MTISTFLKHSTSLLLGDHFQSAFSRRQVRHSMPRGKGRGRGGRSGRGGRKGGNAGTGRGVPAGSKGHQSANADDLVVRMLSNDALKAKVSEGDRKGLLCIVLLLW